MRVAINEARRHGLAVRDHFAIRACPTQITHRNDTVAGYANIAAPAGGTCAINNGRIADDQITAESHGNVLKAGVANRPIMAQARAGGNPHSWYCACRKPSPSGAQPFHGDRRFGAKQNFRDPGNLKRLQAPAIQNPKRNAKLLRTALL